MHSRLKSGNTKSNAFTARPLFFAFIILVSTAFTAILAADGARPTSPKVVSLVAPETPDVYIGIEVLTEAYARIGVKMSAEVMSGDLALRASTTRDADGEVHRIDGITHQFPTLRQIPIPINYIELAVFSHDPTLKPREWLDLDTMTVGIVRGILAAERATRKLNVRRVDTYPELINLLNRDEVEAIIAPRIEIELALAAGEAAAGTVLNGVLDTHLLYHYLHQDQAELARSIEPVLKAMLMSGEVTRLRNKTYERLLNEATNNRGSHDNR